MRIRAGVVLFLLVLAATACSSSSPSSSPTTAASAATTTTAAAAAKGYPSTPAVGHVFVINIENKSFPETWGPNSVAKYMNGTLRPKGQLLSQYFSVSHVSLPNYIAEISGQASNPSTAGDCPIYLEFQSTGMGANGQLLGKGCVFPKSIKTVGDQLTTAGLTWKAYQEDIENAASGPKTCRHPEINKGDPTLVARPGDQYATRHDPFVYFHSIIDTSACAKQVIGLDQLTTDLKSVSTTPNLSFITPNLCNDGHDEPCIDGQVGGLVTADKWVSQWAPKIMASPAFKKDGLLVLTFDEAEVGGDQHDSSACCNTPKAPNVASPGIDGPGGGRTGTLLVGPSITAGTTNATPYNHFALLCSIENAFGLSHLGFAGAPGLKCFGQDVFSGSKP